MMIGTIVVVTEVVDGKPSESLQFQEARADLQEAEHRLYIHVEGKLVGSFDTNHVRHWFYLMEQTG